LKKDLHPEYMKCVVTCACGNTFETRSTVEKIHIEICSQCHPFYTGKQKLVDSAGRVELFHRRYRKLKEKEKAASEENSSKDKKKAEPVEANKAKPAAGEEVQSSDKS